MMATLPEVPAQLKPIQTYMKTAADVERIDLIISYWCRLYSVQTALKIDRKSPECIKFLTSVMDWMEKLKKDQKDNEAITNETVGQAHVENFVMALFNKVDTLDRDGVANKNTVKMFFMAACLFEVMAVFGPLTDEISRRAKYSKFKAAYIQKCLKNGETPHPGPVGDELMEIGDLGSDNSQNPSSTVNPENPPAPQTPQSRPPIPPSSLKPTVDHSKQTPQPSEPCKSSSTNSSHAGSSISTNHLTAINGAPLNPEAIVKTQKYCKFAGSALQYDDISTAVTNLEKALKLLKTGNE
ncbi:Vacuolar protein sorting-associated protein VTA1-like protein [Fragariocoptes setiger]|uniref:Vacuolar protein sorting-associated protein VTA1-like protein n=1 Tax=Fragariocoptes setiger TaxID=1670756 RepID=A0ABQ7S557_9ACAR|nr:Vacuolar protein sorting-associated protein VTA1-like protein [Fragariocoptes setiger]